MGLQMEQKLLSEIVGINVKRAISLSQYKTQEEFAFMFGTDIRNVSRWVNQGVKKIDTADEIAGFLEFETVNLFIDGVEDRKICITL